MLNLSFDETYDVNAMHHSLYGVYVPVASTAIDGLTCLRNK